MFKQVRGKRLVLLLLSLVLLLLGVGSGYYIWKTETGKLPDGTYQLVSATYYSSKAKTWMDGKPGYEGLDLKDFLTVEDQEVKEYTFYTFESSYGAFDNVLPFDFETGNNYRVKAWSKTLKPILSAEDFQKETHDLIGKYYQTSSQVNQKAIDALEKTRAELYQERLEGKVVYDLDEDRLTLKTLDKKGKTIEKYAYRRLSSTDAKTLKNHYQKAVKKYKGNKS